MRFYTGFNQLSDQIVLTKAGKGNGNTFRGRVISNDVFLERKRSFNNITFPSNAEKDCRNSEKRHFNCHRLSGNCGVWKRTGGKLQEHPNWRSPTPKSRYSERKRPWNSLSSNNGGGAIEQQRSFHCCLCCNPFLYIRTEGSKEMGLEEGVIAAPPPGFGPENQQGIAADGPTSSFHVCINIKCVFTLVSTR